MKDNTLIPILIITPFFAPQSHAAMFRVHKLAKYLPKYGYRPIILTTDINYLYNSDDDLLKELPDCVEIIRTHYMEPSLRGVRMQLGGRDRTFSATKHEQELNNTQVSRTLKLSKQPSRSGLIRTTLSSLYGSTVDYLYNIPDAYWTWALASFSTAKELIKKYDINIMYTTANPYSHLTLASKLKKDLDIAWLADFRDPCGYGYKNTASNYIGQLLQNKLITNTLNQADRITGLSEAYRSIFSDIYNLPEERYTFIPTGLDDEYLPMSTPDNSTKTKNIIFAGEVMPEQSSYILEVINELHNLDGDVELKFIGRAEINKPIIETIVSNISNWNVRVTFEDHMPQKSLYKLIKTSTACILAPGKSRYWWTNFAKMVDYIALGTPVIAYVPDSSEARKELSKAGNGFFLKGDDAKSEAKDIEEWLIDNSLTNENLEYQKRYLASSQVASFAKIFDEIRIENEK
ncbi:glycosyltransferase [Psychrobacter sp. UBA6291]|uniref:glycosyltransferase n=1 Tax=Psychrobacter sp. UBA6291 TaxID=1947357 RepID=UPI0025798B97|nr:glycosyltransferase [Psychrobacter sp. UBA6291]